MSEGNLHPRDVLKRLVLEGEDALIESLYHYAQDLGYSKYTSTLREAWRLSVSGLTNSLVESLNASPEMPEFHCEQDLSQDPSTAFGVLEARKHRERGIELGMFLGFLKYYRQSYDDLVVAADLDPETAEWCRRRVLRFYDGIEMAFVREWNNHEQQGSLAELQAANRTLTNEKNKFLTIFESLAPPIALIDGEGDIREANLASRNLLYQDAAPGSQHYGERPAPPTPDWLRSGVKRFLASADDEETIVQEFPDNGETRTMEVALGRMLDISNKFTGVSAVFNDITERLAREHAARLEGRRLDLQVRLTERALRGVDSDAIIWETVRDLQQALPECRITYTTVETGTRFRVLHSAQPDSTESIQDKVLDFTEAEDYLAAVRAGKVLVIHNFDEHDPAMKRLARGTGARAALLACVDLSSGSIALLCASRPEPHEWTDAEITTLKTLGGDLSMVLRELNAHKELDQALEEARRSNAETAGLLEAARAVLREEEFEPAAKHVFEACKRLTGATAGYVALLSDTGEENEVLFLDSGDRECTVDPELPMPIRGLRAEAYRDLKAVCDNDFHHSEWMEFMPGGHVRLDNVLFAPLIDNGRAVGLIGLANKPDDFNENDLRVATGFAEMAAVALQNSRMLQSLEESEARYRQLFNEMQSGFALHEILCDDDGRPTSYRFLEVNPAFEEITGLKADQVVGRTVHEVLPKIEPEWVERYARVGLTGEPDRFEQYSGALEKHFDVTVFCPAPGRFATLFSDETERRRGEDERRRLSTAIEQAAESVMVTDAQGFIEYVNPAWESLSGYTADEARGQTPRLLKSGEHDEAFYREMWETLLAGKVWTGRMTNRRKDSQRYLAESTISPVRDDAGRITHFVNLKRDITREAELEKRLLHAQKMEAIGSLAGGIAHDFNNILQALLGYADFALDEAEPDSMIHQCLGQVVSAANRARDLVAQILTFSRQDAQDRRPFRLQSLLKEVARLLRGTIPSMVEIRLQIRAECGPVLGDPTQVHQVVMNLCTNAYHAMREHGGTLTVLLDEAEVNEQETVHTGVIEPGRYAVINVLDTGCGMDATTAKRIFEPYFTTKDREGGTGLGLATVHGIVTGMGGGITVETQQGQGANFRVFLPLAGIKDLGAGAPATTDLASTTPTATKANAGDTVLLVDDEQQILELGRLGLSARGYEIETCSRGAEALEMFRKDPARFDCLVVDYAMPGMTGLDLARQIKEIRADAPIILCTGYSEDIDDEQARRAGIDAFVLKPVVAGELSQRIQSVIVRAASSPS